MLVSVNPGLIIWTIVTFLLLVIILGRFGWKPIVGALERREAGIRDDMAEAQKARDESRTLLEEHRRLTESAEAEAREIVQAGRETSEQLRREAETDARTEAQRLLDQARRDIQNAKEAALRDIRDAVAQLAVEAAGKIVQKNLDPDRHREMIDDLIDRLPESRVN